MGYSARFNVDGENIVIGRVGANCGCVHQVTGRCWITDNALFTYQRKCAFNTNYLANLLEFLELAKLRGQSGQPLVSQSPIHSLTTLVAPLLEQRKIAEILRTWDKAIEALARAVEYRERLHAALTHQLVFGKKRLGNFRKAQDKKTHQWFDLPFDWQAEPIGKLATEISERNSDHSATEVLSCSKYDGFVRSLDYFKKQVFSGDLSGYKLIWRGDFGFPSNHVEEGSIGLQNMVEIGLVSPIYTIFRFDAKKIDNGYAFSALKTSLYRHIFEVSTSSSVDRRGSLRWKEFAKIEFPVPSLAEQQAIHAVLMESQRLIDQLKKEQEILIRQKRGLMQKLLTGEWRVQGGAERGNRRHDLQRCRKISIADSGDPDAHCIRLQALSQAQADKLRGKSRNVVLDDVLVEQLLRINRFTYRGKEYPFDLEDAHEALRRLKPTPDKLKGLRGTNQDIYDQLILGTTITKAIEGDSKSYSLRYIDWDNPANNVFHVTAEMVVERTASIQTRRCDIVCFVNGVPFAVIENKRPTESLKKADSQLIGYQNEDNIPQLFHYAQILLSMKRQEARYATIGTPRKFWQIWREEEDRDADILAAINRPLTEDEKRAVFSGDLADAKGVLRRAGRCRGAGNFRAGSSDLCALPSGTAARYGPPLHGVRRRHPENRPASAILRHSQGGRACQAVRPRWNAQERRHLAHPGFR